LGFFHILFGNGFAVASGATADEAVVGFEFGTPVLLIQAMMAHFGHDFRADTVIGRRKRL
jgi:hypothetical protein